MKTKAAIITAGLIWFGAIYLMIVTSVGTLLTTVA
jgi:hypothetical protein